MLLRFSAEKLQNAGSSYTRKQGLKKITKGTQMGGGGEKLGVGGSETETKDRQAEKQIRTGTDRSTDA